MTRDSSDVDLLSDSRPQLDGKVVAVVYPSETDDHAVIYSPEFRMQAGRVMLVGKVPPKTIPGLDDVPVALAWDQVQQYYVFDSMEDYLQAQRDYFAAIDAVVPRSFFSYLVPWRSRRTGITIKEVRWRR